MTTRLAAIVAAVAVALALTSAALIGANYVGLNADLTRKPDTVRAPTASHTPMPQAEAAPQAAEEISAEQIEAERLHMVEWLEWQRIIDECMAEAGFDEYSYSNDMTATPFADDYTDAERAAAALALGGNTGAAADYHWEDAGCAGAATHELGIGS